MPEKEKIMTGGLRLPGSVPPAPEPVTNPGPRPEVPIDLKGLLPTGPAGASRRVRRAVLVKHLCGEFGLSPAQVARLFDVHSGTVINILRSGIGGPPAHRPVHVPSPQPDQAELILKDYFEEGMSLEAVSDRYGLPVNRLATWLGRQRQKLGIPYPSNEKN